MNAGVLTLVLCSLSGCSRSLDGPAGDASTLDTKAGDQAQGPQIDLGPESKDQSSPPSCPQPGMVDVGPPPRALPHSCSFTDIAVLVCMDLGGVYVMSSICDPLGCFANLSKTGLFCPCHGGTFDFNGEHPTAKNQGPLPHYNICIDSHGDVWVDTTLEVSPATRN